ncbi:MAG TPA: M90 family metallopeptidase [Flavipsychrobacter sp.]|nr:M90 family metallopeptidase [Flavipsychrobacter sp.]
MNYGAVAVAFLLLLAFIYLYRKSRSRLQPAVAADHTRKILEDQVPFYRKLQATDKPSFEERVNDFLAHTAITGIGTEVTIEDRILVGASAIIPIFAFPGWRYRNIQEVLVYKDTFNKDFSQTEEERNILGMVGDGALNNTMILSQQALRGGFDRNDGHNTAIHEFAHLLDKADGSVDGIPEYLMDKQQTAPWLHHIRQEIANIRSHDNDADINPYAATNEAEFFAVITEYFFEKPNELQAHHPKLYNDLQKIFGNQIAE